MKVRLSRVAVLFIARPPAATALQLGAHGATCRRLAAAVAAVLARAAGLPLAVEGANGAVVSAELPASRGQRQRARGRQRTG